MLPQPACHHWQWRVQEHQEADFNFMTLSPGPPAVISAGGQHHQDHQN